MLSVLNKQYQSKVWVHSPIHMTAMLYIWVKDYLSSGSISVSSGLKPLTHLLPIPCSISCTMLLPAVWLTLLSHMSPLPESEAWTQFKNTLVLPRLTVQAQHILPSRLSRAKIELTQCIFRFLGTAKNTILPLLIVFFFFKCWVPLCSCQSERKSDETCTGKILR